MALIPMGDIPAMHARRLGAERLCVLHGEDALSWGEMTRRANRRANALKRLGVGKNDCVLMSLPNSNAIYEIAFAAWKLGAIPSVLSYRLPLSEFKAVVQLARPKVIFASAMEMAAAVGALPAEYGLREGSDDELRSAVGDYWKAMTSGGSTGRPKIIVDHRAGVVDEAEERMRMPRDKAFLNPGPLYHNAPFAMTSYGLFRGNSIVSMVKFDAQQALELIERHRVAWVNLVPTMMSRIWRLPDRDQYDLSSLEAVWHMAAPCPAWLKEAWIGWLGAERIWEMYGGTERQANTVISGEEWLTHRGSVGRPINNGRIKILGADGAELGAGEVGEVFLRPAGGQGSTYHYVGAAPEATADGFETIGDFGWLDEEGYLYLADRRTDLIISGGANIYPAEVEGALMEHPDVSIAIVIGMPDEDLGSIAHAIVKPVDAAIGRLTEQELRDFVAARLVRYKTPRSYEFTTDILRDDAGKVRRAQLRDQRLAARASA